MLYLFRVQGKSMLPSLQPGSLLLGAAPRLVKPRPGLIAVVKRDKLYIKRIKRISAQGLWIEGDNAEHSTDSRDFGFVDPRDVKAVIFLKLR